MTRLLCMESSSRLCSVAIGDENGVTHFRERAAEQYSHAEDLHVFVRDVLAEAGWQLSDLQGVAVGAGPGSYTGLRIGVAAAKGFCMALDLPLIAVPTTDIIAHAAVHRWRGHSSYTAMIDARRMEVYTATYTATGTDGGPVRAVVLDESFFAALPADSLFVGDGARKAAHLMQEGQRAQDYQPSATDLLPLAIRKHTAAAFEDLAYFEPFYLKDFIPGIRKNP